MKRIAWICVVWLVVVSLVLPGADTPADEEAYTAARRQVGTLYQQKKYAEAARLLEEMLVRYPAHRHANAYNLALMYGFLGNLDRGVEVLRAALDAGVWFGKYDFAPEPWAPYQDYMPFQEFERQNETARQSVQMDAKPELVVKTPRDFERNKTYPLFIALHGGGENLKQFMPRWTSPLLESEYIVAYLQSSQMISMDGFNWTEDIEISKREIAEAFKKVQTEYPVDEHAVLIGGFSSGGVAALEVAMTGTVPVAGFVVLCPARPEGLDVSRIAAARQRGVRGTLLTTEMDGRIAQQREMAALFREAGLQYQFVVTPDIGHWYPENLPDLIDRGIFHITHR